jgi:hypothetical protein
MDDWVPAFLKVKSGRGGKEGGGEFRGPLTVTVKLKTSSKVPTFLSISAEIEISLAMALLELSEMQKTKNSIFTV